MEPADVGAGFGGLEVVVIAVQVDPGTVEPRVLAEAVGVEEGEDLEVDGIREEPMPEKIDEGEGTGGFIAVDGRGEIATEGVGRMRGA